MWMHHNFPDFKLLSFWINFFCEVSDVFPPSEYVILVGKRKKRNYSVELSLISQALCWTRLPTLSRCTHPRFIGPSLEPKPCLPEGSDKPIYLEASERRRWTRMQGVVGASWKKNELSTFEQRSHWKREICPRIHLISIVWAPELC